MTLKPVKPNTHLKVITDVLRVMLEEIIEESAVKEPNSILNIRARFLLTLHRLNLSGVNKDDKVMKIMNILLKKDKL